MISFVVPAQNEQIWVDRCVSAIRNALESVGERHEIVVVDDASTDATASVAQQHGARVIQVKHQQISSPRNAGARQARGGIIFFVDADTLVDTQVIQSALRSILGGAVGGGCVPRFEGWLSLWWRLAYPLTVVVMRLLHQPGGACLFCTRLAYEAPSGFSEAHYAAEEALFVATLKRHGRFVVLTEPVVTSGRSIRANSFWSITRLLTRLASRGPDGFRDRRGLDLWYRPKREKT